MEENPLTGHEPEADPPAQAGTNPAPEASSTEMAVNNVDRVWRAIA